MLRSLAIATLCISLFFLGRWGIGAWQNDSGPEPLETEAGQTRVGPGKIRKTMFYPPVPAALPDLNSGYLFNEQRALEGGDTESAGAEPENNEATEVDIATVQYIGSIISREVRTAIISYPVPVEKNRPGIINRPGIVNRRPVSAAKQNADNLLYEHLRPGDNFQGYLVAAVEPDRLILSKDGGEIVKPLFDSVKQRITPPAESAQPESTPPATGGRATPKRVVIGGNTETGNEAEPAAADDKKGKPPARPQPAINAGAAAGQVPPRPVRARQTSVTRSRSVDLTTPE